MSEVTQETINPEPPKAEAEKPEVIPAINIAESIKKEAEAIIPNLVTEIKDFVVNAISGLKDHVDNKIKDSNLPDEIKEGLLILWEYMLIYIVAFITLGTSFDFFESWKSTGELAAALSLVLLVGAIKRMLFKTTIRKDKTIKEMNEQIKAQEVALSLSTKEESKFKVQYALAIKHIQKTDPTFQTQMLFNEARPSAMTIEEAKNLIRIAEMS